MDKKKFIAIVSVLVVAIGTIIFLNLNSNFKETTHTIEATILSKENSKLTVQDSTNSIYTFDEKDTSFTVGSKVLIEYTGLLNKDAKIKEIKLIEMKDFEEINGLSAINPKWLDGGIFSDFYTLAFNKLKNMSLDEKIAQIFLVKYPDDPVATMKKYQFGGYAFYEKEFTGKTENEVKKMIKDVQDVSKIPILTAVDEEGGTVVRVSKNSDLISEAFKSPKAIYDDGGLEAIKKDTITKSNLLSRLGLNLNLAPVVDVTESSSDYIYPRALGQNTEITSQYASTVIKASKGTGVSYTLKHFPGYGNNTDTHESESIDNRSRRDITEKDLPPFEAGINAGAEAIMVGHMKITNIDGDNPASLSLSVHDILRDDLDFTGVIMTDDLSMGALDDVDDVLEKAIKAGNDILFVSDYEKSFNEVKKALQDGKITEDQINKMAFRVIAWKYYKGLIYDNEK